MNSQDDLATIFKRNRRLAELNPDVAAQVLANRELSQNSPSEPSTHRTKQKREKPARAAIPLKSTPLQPLSFVVPGDCPPKPRQTRSDKWKKRPSVMRYRAWADAARAVCRQTVNHKFPGLVMKEYRQIKIECFFSIPKSWNSVTKERMKGQPHHTKIDCDNLAKSCLDAIFPVDDSHLYHLEITKRWDDGGGARTVITLW